jgi:hypothetical protein
MQKPEPVRRRMQSLDGMSFRFERKGHTVFINDMPAEVHAKDHRVVELATEYKTVRVSGATYWEMINDDLAPTKLLAGMILAKYDELAGRLRRIAAERSREKEDPPGESHQEC